MDRLAEMQNETSPWPGFGSIDIAAIARAQGCPALRVTTADALHGALDDLGLAERREPLLIEAMVEPDGDFNP
jgi:thiamine pyrophosphate-dependent acetolactate synthase large subunit-like protein